MIIYNHCHRPMAFNPKEPNKSICRQCLRGPSHNKRALRARILRETREIDDRLTALEADIARDNARYLSELGPPSPYVFKTFCRPSCQAVRAPGTVGGGSNRTKEVIRRRVYLFPGPGAPPTGSQQMITSSQSSRHGVSALAGERSRRSHQSTAAPPSSHRGGTAATVAPNHKVGDWLDNVR
jgi:hypothetical protein